MGKPAESSGCSQSRGLGLVHSSSVAAFLHVNFPFPFLTSGVRLRVLLFEFLHAPAAEVGIGGVMRHEGVGSLDEEFTDEGITLFGDALLGVAIARL